MTCVDCIQNAVFEIIPSRLLPSYFAPPGKFFSFALIQSRGACIMDHPKIKMCSITHCDDFLKVNKYMKCFYHLIIYLIFNKRYRKFKFLKLLKFQIFTR